MLYCPSCGGEYRDGFVECVDCGVALTAEPPVPPAPPDPGRELVAIYEAGDPGEVALVESLLQDAAIPCVKKGEGLQDLFGAGRLGTGFNPIVGPIAILVPAEHEEAALELLEKSSIGEALDADEMVEPE